MRVSDYIVKALEVAGINTSFAVTGGFAMHLNDSFGKSKIFSNYYHHHEQACGYAALGYSRMKNIPSVVSTTAGVGATNAISPCLDAYQDSVPILFISGQVKSFDTIRAINATTTHKLRNYAFSDCDIISMVSSITKYSHEITSVDEVKEVVRTAIMNLTTGRLGPVWLSVPLDIQGSLIEDTLECPVPIPTPTLINLEEVYGYLIRSERPVILAGNGISLGNCRDKLLKFVEKTRIPVTTSSLGADLIEAASPYFVGRAGLYADRPGNFAIQNSDLLLVLGCRLSQGIVGYNPKTFARSAKIIYVDIDPNELKKEAVSYALAINTDLNTFFDSFLFSPPNYQSWVEKCTHWKQKWSYELPPHSGTTINPYHAVNRLFEKLPENKIVLTAAGTISIIVTQLLNIKKNDRFLVCGQYDMGPDLPMSIGAHISDPSKHVILITGDGTLQFNIQELQTIVHHKFPIKTVVFNNSGYGAIEITQKTYFNNQFGVNASSGLSFPDTEKVAGAYGIKYMSARTMGDLDQAITDFVREEGSVIFEVFCCLQGRYPKVSAVKNADGTFASRPVEDMEPFLPRDEFLREMIVCPLKESM
jgi:acetolactate synthase-1/2/3 large subunit